jgi:hypothetical protein
MIEDPATHLAVLVDQEAADPERVRAAQVLGHFPEVRVLRALCAVAENPEGGTELLEAAGRSVGRIMLARAELRDAFYLADFTETAYHAFEDELGGVDESGTGDQEAGH